MAASQKKPVNFAGFFLGASASSQGLLDPAEEAFGLIAVPVTADAASLLPRAGQLSQGVPVFRTLPPRLDEHAFTHSAAVRAAFLPEQQIFDLSPLNIGQFAAMAAHAAITH